MIRRRPRIEMIWAPSPFVRTSPCGEMRRFTRLTNAFSKKFENHVHMVALYTVW
jgi:hypothetical protein